MADRANAHGHLDASGRREVVYCHACENEWYNDEHGLTCPSCESEATEIVSPENDPRRPDAPEPPPELAGLHEHNPWADEEDEDLQAISPSPFILSSAAAVLRRQNAGEPRGPGGAGGPGNANDAIMRGFNSMITGIVGPSQELGRDLAARQDGQGVPAGRQPGVARPRRNWSGSWVATMERIQRENSVPGSGPGLRSRDGGRVIYRAATVPIPLHRNADGQPVAPGGAALNDLLQSLFGPAGEHNHEHDGHDHGFPPDFQALLTLLSPLGPGGVHGDAVYTQEALDRIISELMEAHPTSNAPGPAPPAAIAALPKKKLDNEMLGPEGKGECSVCMDDVTIGDEVVQLPCGHWFHEACASAWLGEHNTCPICRKGLPTDNTSTPSPSSTADSNHRPSRGSRGGTLHATNPDRDPDSDPDSDHPGGEYPANQFGGGVDWLGRAFIPGRGHYPPEVLLRATVDGVRGPYGLDGRPQVPDDAQYPESTRSILDVQASHAYAAESAHRRGELTAAEARFNDRRAYLREEASHRAAEARGDRAAARGDRAAARGDRAAAEAIDAAHAAHRHGDSAAAEAQLFREAFGQDPPNIEASRRALLNEEASRLINSRNAAGAPRTDEALLQSHGQSRLDTLIERFGQPSDTGNQHFDAPYYTPSNYQSDMASRIHAQQAEEATQRIAQQAEDVRARRWQPVSLSLTRSRSPSLRMPGSFHSAESLQRRDSEMSLDTPAETGPSRTNSESQRSTRSLSNNGNGQSGQSGNGGGSAMSNFLGRFRSNRRQDNA